MIFNDKKLIKVPNFVSLLSSTPYFPRKELESDNPEYLIAVKITAFQSNNKTRHKNKNFNTTNARNGKNIPEKQPVLQID